MVSNSKTFLDFLKTLKKPCRLTPCEERTCHSWEMYKYLDFSRQSIKKQLPTKPFKTKAKRKQSESKPKANRKQTESKPKANRKQTMGCCMSSPVTYESNTYADAHLYQQPYLAPTEKIEKPYDAVGVPVHQQAQQAQQAQQPEIRLNGIEKFLAKMYNMSPEEIAWRKSLPGPYGHYHYGHHGCYGPYGPYGPPMPYGVRT